MTDPAVRIREASRHVTLGLMAWADPPAAPWELELPDRDKQTLYGQAEYVDPFDVSEDWNERA